MIQIFQAVRDKLAALPVTKNIPAIVEAVMNGIVTILAASTGSGKTMNLPGALADASDHQIITMVPRRFLAIDAASNVAELAGIKIGDQVGYALGQMDGESSQRSDITKVLYCTYGYAISSGLINKAKTIVLDEVHEADEHISLARAILRERKAKAPALRILEMSATVRAQTQARYWQGIAQTVVHAVEGAALECERRFEPMVPGAVNRTIEQMALDMLAEGRKGIAVFRPGVKEVEDTVATLQKQLAGMNISDVEVIGIHGGTPSDERRAARRSPLLGKRKIIVGTNVIESGVNLRWLDSGVSDGYRKVPYHRDDSGAEALVLEDIPQSGLLQQIGRINRDPAATGFASGLFILHSSQPFEDRQIQNTPAIARECLNGVAFHAASLGYNPTQLTWDAPAADMEPRLEQAKQELMRLQLIDENWKLTKAGKFIEHLPVSPETGAMLWEAHKIDVHRMRELKTPPRVLRDIVIIAAIAESHGLRKDSREDHKSDQHRTSDLLDGMNAFRALRKEPVAEKVLAATEAVLANATDDELAILKQERVELEALCLKKNVSLNGFVEVARLADEITHRLGERDKGVRVDPREGDDKYDAERYGEVQRSILNGNANHVFLYQNGGLRDLLRDYDGMNFHGYGLGRGSIVKPPKEGDLLVGGLRETKLGEAVVNALTQVTAIPVDVFVAWAVSRAAEYDPIVKDAVWDDGNLAASYAGKALFEIAVTAPLRPSVRKLIDTENAL